MDIDGGHDVQPPPTASSSRSRRADVSYIPETPLPFEASPQRYFDYHSIDSATDPAICIDNGQFRVLQL